MIKNFGVDFDALIEDQRLFNRQIWSDQDRTLPETLERLRYLALCTHEEITEFIRTYEYKTHRRSLGHMPNVAHSHEELIDIFKTWLSMAILAEFPFDRLAELYYAKSQVVQYRWQTEQLKQIDRDCVVVDIDNVIADYISGICTWIRERGPRLLDFNAAQSFRLMSRVRTVLEQRCWVSESTLGISYQQWQTIKHDFRTQGGKRDLPVFEDARSFLRWCRSQGWLIVLLTSRPIDKYPNLFTDTMSWLTKHELPFDFLWWANEKAIRIEEADVRKHIRFAVDDAPVFVEQFRSRGIRCYLLDRAMAVEEQHDAHYATSLTQIMERESVQV